MTNATIKTDRAAAQPWNGAKCKVLRKVEKGDRAWHPDMPQVVVDIDGREVYFFAKEVIEDKPKEAPKPAPAPAPQPHAIGAAPLRPQPPTPAVGGHDQPKPKPEEGHGEDQG